jgi:hypothetical protein
VISRTALLAGLLCIALPAAATPTDIVVRVISQGGKFVGTGMGGADVILRDVRTGEILARGVTSGATGDTARIMTGGPRGTALADAATAGFRTTLDISEPRLVEVEVYGPLAQLQAAAKATQQHWLLPGAPVVGDGWVVELPGLVVDMVEPAAHNRTATGASTVRLTANVALMCGCPIEPGGLWDAARYDVRAFAQRDGAPAGNVAFAYAGATGRFAGDLPLKGKGNYVVTVTAIDRQTGATGVDRSSFVVP